MPHTLLGLDFETYYDDEYSLKKMPPPNYILDRRFETIGCSVKVNEQSSEFVDGPDFRSFIKQFDPRTTTTFTFNALFDNCILAWRYGFVPARMLCTMRMAVAMRGHVLQGASLAAIGKSLGVGTKGTAIADAKGFHRADLIGRPALWAAYKDYANNDNEMSAAILGLLWDEFPVAERRVMDKVLRCAVDPKFIIDVDMLTGHLADLKAEKIRALRLAAGATEEELDEPSNSMFSDENLEEGLERFAKQLRSPVKFAEVLNAHGVDVEYKVSQTDPTVKIPCFAKTDEFMSSLLEHEDPQVQALAAARLGERSTIEQSRTERLLSVAALDWSGYRGGKNLLPVPLKYSGAHTHRLSGDWKFNLQNLPVGRGGKVTKLRKGLRAAPGHKVVKADKAQIECRINAFVCRQEDLLELFRQGKDAYSRLASHIFGVPVDKNTEGGILRFIGKGGELGLGFRCGVDKFYNMVIRQARVLGMDVKELLKVWTPQLAQRSVQTYRGTHKNIENSWFTLDHILGQAWIGNTLPMKFGPVLIGYSGGSGTKRAKGAYVEAPGGLRMWYANPRYEEGEFWYDYGKRRYKIHGGKFLENIVQFLARIDIMNAAIRIGDRTHIDFSLQEHDALAWIVPDAQVDEFITIAREELNRPPSWAPNLPLDCEISFGQSYGG